VPEPDLRQPDQGARLQRPDLERRDDEHQVRRDGASHPERGGVGDDPTCEPRFPGLAAQAAAGAGGGVEVDELKQEPALSFRDLAASYDGRAVWSGASFDIPSGSITAVLGPNGSGKTTLLRLILGQLDPSAGGLEVSGHAPRRGDPGI